MVRRVYRHRTELTMNLKRELCAGNNAGREFVQVVASDSDTNEITSIYITSGIQSSNKQWYCICKKMRSYRFVLITTGPRIRLLRMSNL